MITPDNLPDALACSLSELAQLATAWRDPWWIIGSAAVVLHGVRDVAAADVDILLSEQDAHCVRNARQLALALPQPLPHPLFRSEVFLAVQTSGLPLELMAGFCVARAGTWQPVTLATREPVILPFGTVYVPGIRELLGLFHLFGREKDLLRAKLVAEHLTSL
jgi:hypothetical protein